MTTQPGRESFPFCRRAAALRPLARRLTATASALLLFAAAAFAQSPSPARPPAPLPATLSSSAATQPLPAEARLAAEVEAHLRQQVLAPVFPRILDRRPQGGGFFQEYDRQWRQQPDRQRTLVYQARMTWAAGHVAAARPDLRDRYREFARHGARFLTRVMWDREGGGGFHWRVGPDFQPDLGHPKLMYGQAFGLYALAAAYAGTGDQEWLDAATDAYRWIERHARDTAHGGYFESLERDGRRRGTPGLPGPGWPEGVKTSNTTLHVLEAYTELYAVWPDEQLRKDLLALVELFRDRIILDTGHLGDQFHDDWRVVSTQVSWGHDVEAAHLLLVAAALLGLEDDKVLLEKCRRLVDLALDNGWDDRLGGLYENEPNLRRGVAPGLKVWWPQVEMLLALAMMHERYGAETDRYAEALQLQWRCITRQFTDPQFPGRINSIGADGRVDYRKLHEWKAIYHDVRGLLGTVDVLRRMSDRTRDRATP